MCGCAVLAVLAKNCGGRQNWNRSYKSSRLDPYLQRRARPFSSSAVEHVSLDIEAGGVYRGHRPHRLRQIHADPASQRAAEAHVRGKFYFDGQGHLGGVEDRSGRSASRWGWCSSTRSTSCLKRRCIRTSPSAPATWALTEEEIRTGCVREPARLGGPAGGAAGKVPL